MKMKYLQGCYPHYLTLLLQPLRTGMEKKRWPCLQVLREVCRCLRVTNGASLDPCYSNICCHYVRYRLFPSTLWYNWWHFKSVCVYLVSSHLLWQTIVWCSYLIVRIHDQPSISNVTCGGMETDVLVLGHSTDTPLSRTFTRKILTPQ